MPPVLVGLAVEPALHAFSLVSSEGGSLFWAVDATPAYASMAALSDASGSATATGSATVAAGPSTISADLSALPPGEWWLHAAVVDAAGNASAVISTNVSTLSGRMELNGDQLNWNGDQLTFNAA